MGVMIKHHHSFTTMNKTHNEWWKRWLWLVPKTRSELWQGAANLLHSFVPRGKSPDHYHRTHRGLWYILTFKALEAKFEEMAPAGDSSDMPNWWELTQGILLYSYALWTKEHRCNLPTWYECHRKRIFTKDCWMLCVDDLAIKSKKKEDHFKDSRWCSILWGNIDWKWTLSNLSWGIQWKILEVHSDLKRDSSWSQQSQSHSGNATTPRT